MRMLRSDVKSSLTKTKKMEIIKTTFDELKIVKPDIFEDERGFFMESYNQKKYEKAGIKSIFVQDNISSSQKGVLRGLHYQYPKTQAKLVFVLEGEILDIALDVRLGSPTFGTFFSVILSSQNRKQFYIPEGFAHGFCVLSNTAIFSYKCSNFYAPQFEKGILWCDPDLKIEWNIENPIISGKDKLLKCLKDMPETELPKY